MSSTNSMTLHQKTFVANLFKYLKMYQKKNLQIEYYKRINCVLMSKTSTKKKVHQDII